MLPYLFPNDGVQPRANPRRSIVSTVLRHLRGAAFLVLEHLAGGGSMRDLSSLQLANHRWAIESAVRRAGLGGEHAERAAELVPVLQQIEREMRRRGAL